MTQKIKVYQMLTGRLPKRAFNEAERVYGKFLPDWDGDVLTHEEAMRMVADLKSMRITMMTAYNAEASFPVQASAPAKHLTRSRSLAYSLVGGDEEPICAGGYARAARRIAAERVASLGQGPPPAHGAHRPGPGRGAREASQGEGQRRGAEDAGDRLPPSSTTTTTPSTATDPACRGGTDACARTAGSERGERAATNRARCGFPRLALRAARSSPGWTTAPWRPPAAGKERGDGVD